MSKKKDFSYMRNLVFLSQISLTMIIPILGGVVLGSYVDRRFFNGNVFVIIFTIIGVITSFRNFFVLTKNLANKKEDNKDE